MKNLAFKALSGLLLITTIFLINACSDDDSDDVIIDDGTVGTTTIKMKAEFQAESRLASFSAASFISSCPSSAPTTDDSRYAAGLDCDQDGGVIRFITPSSFKIAFKKLSFFKSDG